MAQIRFRIKSLYGELGWLKEESSMEGASFFSLEWVDSLVEAWNANPQHHKALAGAGTVVFEVADLEASESFILFWDNAGWLRRQDSSDNDKMPFFSAARSDWREFVDGRYSAVAGVMAGRIRYIGRMSYAFRYGPHFDTLAQIARNL